MSRIESKLEQVPQPRDISQEFKMMDAQDFSQFVRTLRSEQGLYIQIEWKDVWTARRLKAFLEATKPQGQQRNAAIRATKEQHDQEMNVFGSGVKWIKVDK